MEILIRDVGDRLLSKIVFQCLALTFRSTAHHASHSFSLSSWFSSLVGGLSIASLLVLWNGDNPEPKMLRLNKMTKIQHSVQEASGSSDL